MMIEPVLKQPLSRRLVRKVAIAGQVKDAMTEQGISGARVKIIDAPEQFINQVLLRAKLLGLSSLGMPPYSCSSKMARHLPPRPSHSLPKESQEVFENTRYQGQDRLQFPQSILADFALTPLQKFHALQAFLDGSSFIPDRQRVPIERTLTTSDGWFYFMDLPPGVYQVEASLPLVGNRYSTAQAHLEIPEENANQVPPSSQIAQPPQLSVEFVLEPTTLVGKIIGADGDQEAIAMASVRIQDSEDHTFSSSEVVKQHGKEWNYRFSGIDAGDSPRTVIVVAKGYLTDRKEIKLQPGKSQSLDFALRLQ
ncbi:MAG: carboxypeptidase-like regulatory domain-containing protein [Synechococcales bacterium]|nr:carboxypeptidase-like regulatory domain-containing protein [Synechococcales bacterium]